MLKGKSLEISDKNQALFVDLDDEKAEKISGGSLYIYEEFDIGNQTNCFVKYTLDGELWSHNPGDVWSFTTFGRGIITFDEDCSEMISYKTYDLAHNGQYEFQYNLSTADPYDIELYKV